MAISETTPGPIQPPAPKQSVGVFALLALIVGGIAFLTGLIPIWGILAGAAAVALGILALNKHQNKGLAISGLALGAVAALSSLMVTIALFSGVGSRSDSTGSPAPAVTLQSQPSPSATPTPTATPTPSATPTPTPTVAPEPPAPVETLSQANARRQAQNYLNYTAFSRTGLIEQLQYEGYSLEDATYGVDSLGADWATQAALKAQEYLDYMPFSHSGLVEQLIFEGFTPEEAEFGVAYVGL